MVACNLKFDTQGYTPANKSGLDTSMSLGMRGAMSASQICMPTKSQKQPEVENQKHKSPSFLLPHTSEFSLTELSSKSKFVKDSLRFLG